MGPLLLWRIVVVTDPEPLFSLTRMNVGANMKLLCLVAVAATTAESELSTHVMEASATGLVGLLGSSKDVWTV